MEKVKLLLKRKILLKNKNNDKYLFYYSIIFIKINYLK